MSPRDVGVAGELAQDALVAALDLLATLHRNEEAIREFERAAALTRNESERGLLRRRAARVVDGSA
jgi:predicted RNA polymerase sigma factor